MKEVKRETPMTKKLGFVQEEMFPDTFHESYKVVNHSYYIDENGKSVWYSSQITWKKVENGNSI
jgi:hypothetical protein